MLPLAKERGTQKVKPQPTNTLKASAGTWRVSHLVTVNWSKPVPWAREKSVEQIISTALKRYCQVTWQKVGVQHPSTASRMLGNNHLMYYGISDILPEYLSWFWCSRA